MDQTTSDDELTCPKDGSSLSVDNDQNYCQECESFYCPICLTPWSPFENPDDEICPHYVAHYAAFYGGYSDENGRDNGLLDARIAAGGNHSDSAQPVPPATFTELYEDLRSDKTEQAEAILEEMDEDETETTFGPLYQYMQDADTFEIDTACEALEIPIRFAHFDDMAWMSVYFSPIGGDQAWNILRPALQKYVEGVAWLEEQVS